VLAYPSVQLLDVTGPLQVFASANDLVTEAGGMPPYALRVVAQGGKVTASAGLGLAVDPLPPAGAGLDTLMIAGGQGVEAAAADALLVGWVRERAGHARRIASVCNRGVPAGGLRFAGWAAGGDPLVGLRRACPAFLPPAVRVEG